MKKTIAIDLMGGDEGFYSSYPAIVKFLKNNPEWSVIGFATEETIIPSDKPKNLEIRFTRTKISSDASPLEVARHKDSTMVKAIMASVNNEADATISAGASGPLVTASFLFSKTINQKLKPAFAPMYSGTNGSIKVILDAGANIEVLPEDLLNFAFMGEIFLKAAFPYKNIIKVGLLNIGIEENKGDKLRQEGFKLLKENNKNFIGNVEANDALFTDADVIVSDAYSGNIALKSIEGTLIAVKNAIKSTAKKPLGFLGLLLAKKDLTKNLKHIVQEGNIGGAVILGINNLILKVHGSAKLENFEISLNTTKRLIESALIDTLKEKLTTNGN